jgi:hypothetical protein
MSALTDDTLPVTPRAIRDEMIVFAVMAVLLAVVPWTGIYPFFVMQALCFALLACAINLLSRLWQLALVRPRDVPGYRRLRLGACAEGLGTVA